MLRARVWPRVRAALCSERSTCPQGHVPRPLPARGVPEGHFREVRGGRGSALPCPCRRQPRSFPSGAGPLPVCTAVTVTVPGARRLWSHGCPSSVWPDVKASPPAGRGPPVPSAPCVGSSGGRPRRLAPGGPSAPSPVRTRGQAGAAFQPPTRVSLRHRLAHFSLSPDFVFFL